MRGIFAILGLCACESDKSLTVQNPAPQAEILHPKDGDSVPEGTPTIFWGTVNDSNHTHDELSTTWYLDGDIMCDDIVPDQDGTTSCEMTLGIDNQEITLAVRDLANARGEDSVTVVVVPTESPIAAITTPVADGVYYSDQLITFEGHVSDAETENTSLTTYWESNADGILTQVDSIVDINGNVLGFGYVSAGQHAIQFHVTDSSGKIGQDTVIITVHAPNTAPSAPLVSIFPNPATTLDNLLVNMDTASVDAEGDVVTYTYAWSLNGQAQPNQTSSTIPASATQKGEQWSVTVTPSDAMNTGMAGTASIIISNTAPTITASSITPQNNAFNDTTYTCNATIQDPDEIPSITYQWFINQSLVLSGSNSITLTPTLAMPTDILSCTITATDADSATTSSSAQIVVQNRAPTLANTQISPSGAITPSSTLQCTSSATDADGETPLLTYQWSVNGQTFSGSSLNLNANLVSAGDTITCTAIAVDGYGGSATDSVSVVVSSAGNTAPYFSVSALIVTNGTQVGSSWTCVAGGSDAEDGVLTPTYEWLNNSGAVIQTGANLSITASNSAPNTLISCRATITDSGGLSATSTDTEMVQNSVPSTPSISISPSAPVAGVDNLTCSIVSPSTDADLDSIIYSFTWSNSSGTQQSTSSASLSDTIWASQTNAGTWTCTVYATDGMGNSTTATASVLVSAGGCSYHVDCGLGQYCAEWRVDSQFHCSSSCSTDADCAAGETCSHLPGGANVHFCETTPPNTLSGGASCSTDSQCASGFCIDYQCEDTCAGEMDCASTESCHGVGNYATGDLYTSCGPHGALNDIGQTCYGNGYYGGEWCETGHCDLHQYDFTFLGSPAYCRPLCSTESDCDRSGPYPEVCDVVLVGPTPPSNSVAIAGNNPQPYTAITACYEPWNLGTGQIGSVCTSNDQCSTNKCFNIQSGNPQRFCTALCETNADCTGGTTCKTGAINLTNEWMVYESGYTTSALQGMTTLLRICAF